MAAKSGGIGQLEEFAGFEIDDDCISTSSNRKRALNDDSIDNEPKQNHSKRSNKTAKALKTTGQGTLTNSSLTDSSPPPRTDTTPSHSNAPKTSQKGNSTNNNEAQTDLVPEQPTCIIVRKDKKILPLSFINTSRPSWPVLQLIDPNSFMRNSKGTVIRGNLLLDKVNEYKQSNKTFQKDGIIYEAFIPREISPHMGELQIDLRELEDKSILQLNVDDLSHSIKTNSETNKIISISKIYPRKPVQERDFYKFTSIRLCLEFSDFIPRRVFFEQVSLPISHYIVPPKICYQCQRYGHGAISCKRKLVCGTCAGDHSQSECTAPTGNKPSCAACEGEHKSSSTMCPFYKRALHIAKRAQKREITNKVASRMYAALYVDGTDGLTDDEDTLSSSSVHSLNITNQPSPSFPPLTPSPVIKTKSRIQPKKSQTHIPETPEEKEDQSDNFTSSQQTQPSKSSKQKSLSLWDIDDSYVTPGQKKKKTPQVNKTPIHKSQTYANILNGKTWSGNQQNKDQNNEDQQMQDDTSEIFDPLITETPYFPPETFPGNSSKSSPTLETDTEEQVAEPNLICGFFKSMLKKIAKWIKQKIKEIFGNNSCNSFLQELVSSFFAMLN